MDVNPTNPNLPTTQPDQAPVSPEQAPTPPLAGTVPQEPVFISQPTIVQPKPKFFGRKLVFILIFLILVGGVSAAYFLIKKQPVATPTAKTGQTFTKLTLPNQPKQLNDQFVTQNFTSGFVDYKAGQFSTVKKNLPAIAPISAAVAGTGSEKQVVFMNDIAFNGAGNGHRLLMYDVASKQTYIVDQSTSNGRYDNARIMSNHYIVFAETLETDPVTQTTVIRAVDLQTGKSQTIMTDKAANLPVSLCCSVSKDGLRMVIPQDGKFLIYQAGETKPTALSADVKVFPTTTGSGGGDYEASQRNYGYPPIIWLDDNTFMYAKAHPLKWTVDSQGSHSATNNNGLAIYNLNTGKSADVSQTLNSPVNWFSVDGDSVTYSTYKPNVGGVVDGNSGLTIFKISNFNDSTLKATDLLSVPLDYQSYLYYDLGTKKLYVQPAGAGLDEDTTLLTVLDTTTGKVEKKKLPSSFKSPYLKGFMGANQAVIDDSYSVSNDYYLYNVQNDNSQLILSASTTGN